MTKEKLQYYTQMINNKQLNTDILISCLANLEPRISKAAYLRAKFKNSGMVSNEGHEHEMKQYMKYRTQKLLIFWLVHIQGRILRYWLAGLGKMILLQTNCVIQLLS